MTDPDYQKIFLRRGRILQIIVGAMATGVVAFLIIAVVLHAAGTAPLAPPAQRPIFAIAAAALLVMAIVGAVVLPKLIASAGRKWLASGAGGSDPADHDAQAEALMNEFAAKTLVGAAMFEGAALFAIVTYLLEARLPSIVIALIALFLLLSQFPTKARFADWLDQRIRESQQQPGPGR